MKWIDELFKLNIVQDISSAEALFSQHNPTMTSSIHKHLRELTVLPHELNSSNLADLSNYSIIPALIEWEMAEHRKKKHLILFAQIHHYQNFPILVLNDARGAVYWITLENDFTVSSIQAALSSVQQFLNKKIAIVGHQDLMMYLPKIESTDVLHILLLGYSSPKRMAVGEHFIAQKSSATLPQHLQKLEDESIYIIREAVAEAENPVMLYSIGKDSTVMLHLAYKAFYPAPPPFKLLHVDTQWKFQEMYAFRDAVAHHYNIPLFVHINPEAIQKNINPFDHGASLHTDITKTQGLKQALTHNAFDVVFGGARRDEEKSRAKERIFSFRNAEHQWDPKNQRPELWNLYNGEKLPGESIRVFPLSNWTELDIWDYIASENIPVVPLYFAKPRPVVERNGMLLLVDDHRFAIREGEKIQLKNVRFRTLGCYPLTGAVESEAQNLTDILQELRHSRYSERQGRAIDHDSSASMEKKKRDGYF